MSRHLRRRRPPPREDVGGGFDGVGDRTRGFEGIYRVSHGDDIVALALQPPRDPGVAPEAAVEKSLSVIDPDESVSEPDGVVHVPLAVAGEIGLAGGFVDDNGPLGGESVTLRVGEMDGGFYVADTGAGIPEAEREAVFEAGHSTSEEGTGFGLRIVKQVVDAHGWDISVSESQEGEARFEITGVETVE